MMVCLAENVSGWQGLRVDSDHTGVKRPGIYGLKAGLHTGSYIRQTFVVRPLGRIFGQEVSGWQAVS